MSEDKYGTVAKGLETNHAMADEQFKPEPKFFSDLVPAAFRLENSVVSALSDQGPARTPIDPEFDPIKLVPEEHAHLTDRYAFLNSEDEVNQMTEQLNRELQDRETLDSGGFLGFLAAVSAGVVDPINFIPVGGQVARGVKTGETVLNSAYKTSMVAAGGATLAEAALRETQETRSLEESALNVTGAILLGGAIGGAAGGVRNLFKSGDIRTVKEIADAIDNDFENLNVPNPSVGAAFSDAPTTDELFEAGVFTKDRIDEISKGSAYTPKETKAMEQYMVDRLGWKKTKAVEAVERLVTFQDPTTRVLHSDVGASRKVMEQLAEIPAIQAKNAAGTASDVSVERLAKNWQAPLYESLRSLDNSFVQYVHGRSKQFGDIAKTVALQKTGLLKGKLTFSEFKEAVGMAMRRGDSAETLNIPNEAKPFVSQAAASFRKQVFDPLKDAAVELKMLDESVDVETAVSYLNRVYDIEKIADPVHFQDFVTRTANWLEARQLDARNRVDEFDAQSGALTKQIDELEVKVEKVDGAKRTELNTELQALKKQLSDMESTIVRDRKEADLSRQELEETARQIANRIVSTPDGRLPYDESLDSTIQRGGGRGGAASPFQARVFNIDDELIEPFLLSDVEVLAKRYSHQVGTDVSMVQKFESIDMVDQIKDITKAWDDQIAKWVDEKNAADKAKNKGESERLAKLLKNAKNRKDSDIRDVAAVRDRLRGAYKLPEDPGAWTTRAVRAVQQLNYVRLLGGMTVSAIPDAARLVMVHGMKRTMKDALAPLVSNLKTLKRNSRELRWLGQAADMLVNSRAEAIAGVDDYVFRRHWSEKALGAVSDTFGMVSLMAPWNTAMKSLAGAMSMQRILKNVAADVSGKISKKEREYLRFLGIGEDQSRMIKQQFEKFGETENDFAFANTPKWQDPKAFEAFQSALGKDIDRIIVTPGQDKPLAASGAWGDVGRLMFQFKSFAIASTQRTLVAGLQQQDANFFMGASMAVSLGMVVAAIKEHRAGRSTENWDFDKFVVEGIDRSGLTGWFFDANNMIEKASRGSIGLNRITGNGPMSRYASRNVVGAFLGPTFGTAQTAFSVSGNAAAAFLGDDELKQSDIHAARRLIPYQNLIGAAKVFDAAEENINKVFNVDD